MFDLLIRNGTVVDGTGQARRPVSAVGSDWLKLAAT